MSKIDFGCNSAAFAAWHEDSDPGSAVSAPTDQAVLRFSGQWLGVTVYKGGPGKAHGFTVYADDYVANDWATWYADLATALREAAALIESALADQSPGYQAEIATVAA